MNSSLTPTFYHNKVFIKILFNCYRFVALFFLISPIIVRSQTISTPFQGDNPFYQGSSSNYKELFYCLDQNVNICDASKHPYSSTSSPTNYIWNWNSINDKIAYAIYLSNKYMENNSSPLATTSKELLYKVIGQGSGMCTSPGCQTLLDAVNAYQNGITTNIQVSVEGSNSIFQGEKTVIKIVSNIPAFVLRGANPSELSFCDLSGNPVATPNVKILSSAWDSGVTGSLIYTTDTSQPIYLCFTPKFTSTSRPETRNLCAEIPPKGSDLTLYVASGIGVNCQPLVKMNWPFIQTGQCATVTLKACPNLSSVTWKYTTATCTGGTVNNDHKITFSNFPAGVTYQISYNNGQNFGTVQTLPLNGELLFNNPSNTVNQDFFNIRVRLIDPSTPSCFEEYDKKIIHRSCNCGETPILTIIPATCGKTDGQILIQGEQVCSSPGFYCFPSASYSTSPIEESTIENIYFFGASNSSPYVAKNLPNGTTPTGTIYYVRFNPGMTYCPKIDFQVTMPYVDCNAADLEVKKIVDKFSVNPGETVTYTITLINKGPTSTTNVKVKESFPSTLLTFISANASGGSSYDSATHEWTLPSVALNTTYTLVITAKVK